MRNKGAISFGPMAIDFDRMELRRSGRLIPSTSLELRLLKFFVDSPERVFSRGTDPGSLAGTETSEWA